MTSRTRSVLFVDDHNLVASAISALLRMRSYDVTTANNLVRARDAMESSLYDLLLLDINLGTESGLTLLEKGTSNLPRHTIMLSGTSEQEWIFRGFELGAFGFISKNVEPDELLSAIESMVMRPPAPEAGWIWDTQQKTVVSAYSYFQKETILTSKEREVFMHMREGRLDKQIADIMGLSIHTIRVSIRAIKRKRGHNRRLEQVF